MALNGTIQGFRLFSSPSPGRNFMPNFVERFFFVLLLFCARAFFKHALNSFYLIRAFLLKEFSLLHFEANISRNKLTTLDAHQYLVEKQERFILHLPERGKDDGNVFSRT